MSTYHHVTAVTREVHDSLMGWARRLLNEAGLDTVEVYGQFPPPGTMASFLVMFPYRIGPEPKMSETAPGVSLLVKREPAADRVGWLPRPWAELGNATLAALELGFKPFPQVMQQLHPVRDALPYPRLETLAPPLRDWYESGEPAARKERGWTAETEGARFAIPPALGWKPGINLTARYIVVVGEPGRGTSERTSASAPIGLSALSVLTTGLHLENMLQVNLPPLPCTPELFSYCEALASACALMNDDAEVANKLRQAVQRVSAVSDLPVQLQPVHDLTNHEFAVLMQALQRPLQAALNLQLRLQLGARAFFEPSVATRIKTDQPRSPA